MQSRSEGERKRGWEGEGRLKLFFLWPNLLLLLGWAFMHARACIKRKETRKKVSENTFAFYKFQSGKNCISSWDLEKCSSYFFFFCVAKKSFETKCGIIWRRKQTQRKERCWTWEWCYLLLLPHFNFYVIVSPHPSRAVKLWGTKIDKSSI